MPRSGSLALLGVLLSLAGCSNGFRYAPAPALPQPGPGEPFELRAVAIKDFEWSCCPKGGLGVVLQARSRIRAEVRGAFLAHGGSEPCRGVPAFGYRLDGEYFEVAALSRAGATPSKRRNWVDGDPVELELRFDGEPLSGWSRAPVDAYVSLRPLGQAPGAEDLCVRVPLLTRSMAVEWRSEPTRWFGANGYRMVFLPAHPEGVVAAFFWLIEVGAWVGPVRLGVEGAFGFVRTDRESVHGAAGGSGALAAMLPLWEGERDVRKRKAALVALEGAWTWLWVSGDRTSSYSAALQGPRLGILIGSRDLPPMWAGFEPADTTPTVGGVQLFVSHWQAGSGQSSWSFGFGVVVSGRVIP